MTRYHPSLQTYFKLFILPKEAYKPNSVPDESGGSHLSGTTVTGCLDAAYPQALKRATPVPFRRRIACYLALLPVGDTWPALSPTPPVGFYPAFSALPPANRRRIVLCGPVPPDRSAWALPSTALYGVRTFLERLEAARGCPASLGKVILARAGGSVKKRADLTLALTTSFNLYFASMTKWVKLDRNPNKQEAMMHRKLVIPFVLMSLLLAAAFGLIPIAFGQGPDGSDKPVVVTRETQGENTREISAPAGSSAPQQTNISFIDSPTIGCHMPDPRQDACYINWYYMSVNANPNYMVAMTVTVNTVGVVAKFGGFFQTSMYVPYDMFGEGFKVSCGAPGAGGDPNLGNAYAWSIQARDSSNLSSANYGTAYCPAYRP